MEARARRNDPIQSYRAADRMNLVDGVPRQIQEVYKALKDWEATNPPGVTAKQLGAFMAARRFFVHMSICLDIMNEARKPHSRLSQMAEWVDVIEDEGERKYRLK